MSGEWSASALGDALAETIFFAGVLLFVQSSVSSIKYLSRTHNASYELDPRSIELAKQGNPSEATFRQRVWQNEYTFNKGSYDKSQWGRMIEGKAPLVDGKSMHLHHVVGRSVDPYYVIKVTSAQHTAIHKAIGYHVTNPKLPWILENAIKYGGLM